MPRFRLRNKTTLPNQLLLLLTMCCPLTGTASPIGVGGQAEQKPGQSSILLPLKVGLLPVPLPALDSLEKSVGEQIASFQNDFEALAARPNLPERDLAEAYGTLGQLYQAYRFTDASEACYLNAHRLAPKDFHWVYLLGTLYRQGGRLSESLLYYEAGREIQPDYVALAVNLGNVYLQLNRFKEARREFERALALDSDCAAAQAGLGDVALSDRRYSEAIHHFEQALARVPKANRIHYSLAMAYRAMGEQEKAQKQLAQRGRVGIRPPDPLVDSLEGLLQGERVHLIRGRLAFHSRRFQEAAQAFAQAVEARPDSVRARVNLGSALGETGDPEGAMEQYREALRLSPDNATAHYNLGSLLAHKEKHGQAIVHFRRVLEMNPGDREANRELAQSLLKTDRGEEASLYFSKAVASDPSDEETLLQWATLLIRQGRYEETREHLDWAHGLFPRRGRTAHALARLLAACPDLSVRDGRRALELAKKIYSARKTIGHGENVALALAELDRCSEAAQWQSRMVAAAEQAGEADLAKRLRTDLARYQRGSPCCLPGRSHATGERRQ